MTTLTPYLKGNFLNYKKTILLWQIPNILPKDSCLGPLLLKPRIKYFCETFMLYVPLCIHPGTMLFS